MSGKRGISAGIVFTVVIIILCALCAAMLIRAENQDREYRYLASLTPTPSAVPRKVSYIFDNQTPVPTRIQLSSGAMGQTVYDIQARLKELGYYPYDPDAKFGPGTLEAVKRFQAENGLKEDGIVGEETFRVLMSSTARPCPTAVPK